MKDITKMNKRELREEIARLCGVKGQARYMMLYFGQDNERSL